MIYVDVSASTILMSGTTTNLPSRLTDETIGLSVLIGDASEYVPGIVLAEEPPPGGWGPPGSPPGWYPIGPPIDMPETGLSEYPDLEPDLDSSVCPNCGRADCPFFTNPVPIDWRPPTRPPAVLTLDNTEGDNEEDDSEEDDNEGDDNEEDDNEGNDNEEDDSQDTGGTITGDNGGALEEDPFGPRALNTIYDTTTAVQAVHNAFIRMSPEYLETGLLELFAEQAIGRAASGDVSGNVVVVSQATIAPFENIAIDTRDAIYGMLRQEGYEPWRELRANISFVTNYREMELKVEPSPYQGEVQHVNIRTPYYEVTFPKNFFASEVADDPLTVNIMAGNIHTINFSREVELPLILSVQPLDSIEPAYQTLKSIEGETAHTKYNPASGLLDTSIGVGGIFTTAGTAPVSFGDIQGLSEEMQDAIDYLARKNFIRGTGINRFSPENSINRAEIASITVRMLGMLDPSAGGRFDDMHPSNWFYASVNSAYNHGIMQGNGRSFYPSLIITRSQLTSVSARIFRKTGLSTPSNPNHHLLRFTDRNDIESWSVEDIALATQLGIVIYRTDGYFLPNAHVNRGDAALMLHRMYQRLCMRSIIALRS